MFSLKGRGLGNILRYLFFKDFFQIVIVKKICGIRFSDSGGFATPSLSPV
jgi:hypothetical protein